jgi:DtxR family Mn-dependent transcriptional regulator
MQSSFREDILEALYKAGSEGRSGIGMRDLALLIDRDIDDLEKVIPEMEREGDLVTLADGMIMLTPGGVETGGKIMRKHRILECFFLEMLGMTPESAAVEACTLEHKVSDEAIDRLGRYILAPERAADPRGIRRRKRRRILTLEDASEGEDLEVVSVRCRGSGTRLHDLGIFPGTIISVIRKIPGNGLVVRVKGSDIALSSEIAASILVERVG